MARTVSAIQAQGVQARRERGSAAKLAYLLQKSRERFDLLPWVLEARALDLHVANRRVRRRAGLSLSNNRANYNFGGTKNTACKAVQPVVECIHAGGQQSEPAKTPIPGKHKERIVSDNINGSQTAKFNRNHKGIYSSFRLPGVRGSVCVSNKLFPGGEPPAELVIAGLVPAGEEGAVGDTDKAAERAKKAQEKADAAKLKAEARATKAQLIADKAKAAAEAALARAAKAQAAATGDAAPAAQPDL